MISIETTLFNIVKDAVKSICPNYGTVEQATPSSFPYMLFVQKDNPSYKGTQDSDSKENHVQPMIQIDIFSNKSMYECKTIIAKADDEMQKYGFERIFGAQPIPTGSTYYRITARYQGIVQQNALDDFTVI